MPLPVHSLNSNRCVFPDRLKHDCLLSARAFTARVLRLACCFLAVSLSAQTYPAGLGFPNELVGERKDGGRLRMADICPLSYADYHAGYVKRISWDRPEALKLELDALVPGRPPDMSAATAVQYYAHHEYFSAVGGQLEVALMNQAFTEAELQKAFPAYRDPAPLVGAQMDYFRTRFEQATANLNEASEAEQRRRYEAYYAQPSSPVPPQLRSEMVEKAMTKWKLTSHSSNLPAIRHYRMTRLSLKDSAVSNFVWQAERAHWMHQLCLSNIAQKAHLAPATAELTNRFLWSKERRFSCAFVYAEKTNSLAPLQRDLLAQSPASTVRGRLDLHVAKSSELKRTFGTCRLSGTMLEKIDPTINSPAVLPRVVFHEVNESDRHTWQVRLNQQLPAHRIEVLLVIEPSPRTVAEEMMEVPPEEWRRYLAVEGEIQSLHARLREPFKSVNPNVFPTPDSLRWVASTNRHFGGIFR